MSDDAAHRGRGSDDSGPRRGSFLWHSCGCMTLLIFATAVLVGVGWWQRGVLFAPGGPWDRLVAQVDAWRGHSSGDVLQSIRAEVRDIQTQTESLVEREDIRKRLDDLRGRIAERRDRAAQTFREQWDQLARRGEDIVEGTRERTEDLRRQLEELMQRVKMLEQKEKQETGTEKPQTEGQ